MTSAWIKHVKDYQQKNGCSYKEAMTKAKATYNKTGSGVIQDTVRKVKNTAKRVAKEAKKASAKADKHQEFINLINADVGKVVQEANDAYKTTAKKAKRVSRKVKEALTEDHVEGAGMKTVKRKAKNTVKKARRVAKNVAPLALALGQPEMAIGLEAIGAGHSNDNKYIQAMSGGSFKVGGKFHGHDSSLLNPLHPSFTPLPPKPIARKQREN